MKIKKDRKQKSTLKVKKESKTGESSLKKAVKNVKEILKKDDKAKLVVKKEVKKEQKIKKSDDFIKISEGQTSRKKLYKVPAKTKCEEKKKAERGLVYIGHIPHGFYEEQMKRYFSQFGRVTRVRVCRSQITGRSKGYGFVEFLHPEVAKIAAESMQNYLMCNRLLKAEYIPPEKQHRKYFKGAEWTIVGHPKLKRRLKSVRAVNASKPNAEYEKFLRKTIYSIFKLSQQLKKRGIDLKMKFGKVVV